MPLLLLLLSAAGGRCMLHTLLCMAPHIHLAASVSQQEQACHLQVALHIGPGLGEPVLQRDVSIVRPHKVGSALPCVRAAETAAALGVRCPAEGQLLSQSSTHLLRFLSTSLFVRKPMFDAGSLTGGRLASAARGSSKSGTAATAARVASSLLGCVAVWALG